MNEMEVEVLQVNSSFKEIDNEQQQEICVKVCMYMFKNFLNYYNLLEVSFISYVEIILSANNNITSSQSYYLPLTLRNYLIAQVKPPILYGIALMIMNLLV